VIDTIDVMFKRRQLDNRQKRAADSYRVAFDALTQIEGVLDMDRGSGSGSPGAPPLPAAMAAAATLGEANTALAAMDGAIVELIVGRGYSIEQSATAILGGHSGKSQLSERDTEYVGKRLRDALTTLARLWHPVSDRASIRSYIEDGAKPVGGRSGTRMVETCVVHASEGAVFFSDQEKP
jgi:hypothetical protein